MKNIILFTFIVLTILSCVFKRDNPLDPEYSNINPPTKVSNLDGESYTGEIRLWWTPVSNASGYKVYRSKVHNGAYELLNEIDNNGKVVLVNFHPSYDNPYNNNTSDVSSGWYYYKASACIIIQNHLEPLEGELSEWLQIYIQ